MVIASEMTIKSGALVTTAPSIIPLSLIECSGKYVWIAHPRKRPIRICVQ